MSLLIVFAIPFKTFAAAGDNQQEVGFDIQAIIPENQVDTKQSYFDLRMTPGQKQTIQVVVNNTSAEDGKYEISVNQAYTNSQGFIDYKESIEPDESQEYSLKDIVEYPKELEVSANSSQTLDIAITMPEKEYDGQILAGIQVNKVMEKTEGISNAFGYVLGLKLTENDNEVKRDLKLLSVEPGAAFGKSSIIAKLQNPTMDAFGHLKYESKVYQQGTKDLVFEKNYDSDMQMAPNSTYDFAIEYGKALKAGDYTLDLTVSDAKDNVWHFTEDFTITAKEADDINKVTVTEVAKKDSNWWIYVIAGLLAAVVVLLIILLLKRRKKDDENKDNEESSK